ncbi:MAG: TlpA family protein disulfide reductase [Mycobacteriales bacterium]
MTAVVVALGCAVLLLAVLVAGLLRSHAEILKALHELGAGLDLDGAKPEAVPVTVEGVTAPRATGALSVPDSVSGETVDGDVLGLSLLGQDTLVAFLSSGCTTCQVFWQAFRSSPELPVGARLVVVTKGPDEESPSAVRERQPTDVPVLMSSETWEAFGVPGSPYFAYVDAGGRLVGEGSGASWPQVLELMRQAQADRRSGAA